jgi:hypothetical protein
VRLLTWHVETRKRQVSATCTLGANRLGPSRRTSRAAPLILLLVAALTACSPPAHPAAVTTPRSAATKPGPDPRSAAALVLIAQAFNDNYDRNNDGPVWDRWDVRSQAVISRADYIRRHAECATAPQGPAHVEDAIPGPNGAWLVRYEIGGQQLTDYWFYVRRRWVFDLLLSNPSAAGLYRLPFAQYAAQIGCQDH